MSMTFRLTLANDDTKTAIANLVAENVLAFIDHIDVMGNNGSLVLERIDFDHQSLAFAEHDPDSYARIRCALQGGSTGATFGIPAYGQITLYIPVFSNRSKCIDERWIGWPAGSSCLVARTSMA